MTNVLITGGTGFVGSWMIKTKPDDFNAWAMSRADYEKVIIPSVKGIDYVIHLAPVAPGAALECARRNNVRLLYCSSGIVYHPENDTEYRQNKIKWERECLDSGQDVVIARLFTFWGSSKAQLALFRAAREGKPLEVWSCTRSFMHGSDMGRWLWAILLHGQTWQAYDVGSDRPVTIDRLARRIKALCNTKSGIIYKDDHAPMPEYVPQDTGKTRQVIEKG